MMNTNMPSLADIAAVTGNNDAFGGNSGWWVLILLFAIFGGWGNGYGANSGVAENYTLASDFANISRQIDSTTADIKSGVVSIGNGLSSLGYDQLNQINGVNSNINAAQNNLMAQLNAMQANYSQCCCENKYLMAEQACQTRQAVVDSQAAIIARIDAMQTSAMQDKINQLQMDNQALKFAASQQAQNAYLINQLGNNGCCCG